MIRHLTTTAALLAVSIIGGALGASLVIAADRDTTASLYMRSTATVLLARTLPTTPPCDTDTDCEALFGADVEVSPW